MSRTCGGCGFWSQRLYYGSGCPPDQIEDWGVCQNGDPSRVIVPGGTWPATRVQDSCEHWQATREAPGVGR
jgi:hypothetical protein